MSTLNLSPQWVCESASLQEGEPAVMFDVLEWGQLVPAFALRFDGQAVAFLNRCAHVPVEMDWQAGHFWDQDKRFIICSVHGALYEPSDGQCVAGPCAGGKLVRIDLREEAGQVYWYPSDRFQPVF